MIKWQHNLSLFQRKLYARLLPRFVSSTSVTSGVRKESIGYNCVFPSVASTLLSMTWVKLSKYYIIQEHRQPKRGKAFKLHPHREHDKKLSTFVKYFLEGWSQRQSVVPSLCWNLNLLFGDKLPQRYESGSDLAGWDFSPLYENIFFRFLIPKSQTTFLFKYMPNSRVDTKSILKQCYFCHSQNTAYWKLQTHPRQGRLLYVVWLCFTKVCPPFNKLFAYFSLNSLYSWIVGGTFKMDYI